MTRTVLILTLLLGAACEREANVEDKERYDAASISCLNSCPKGVLKMSVSWRDLQCECKP